MPEGLDLARVTVEAPREAGHGDITTNAAMVLAKQAGMKYIIIPSSPTSSLRRFTLRRPSGSPSTASSSKIEAKAGMSRGPLTMCSSQLEETAGPVRHVLMTSLRSPCGVCHMLVVVSPFSKRSTTVFGRWIRMGGAKNSMMSIPR